MIIETDDLGTWEKKVLANGIVIRALIEPTQKYYEQKGTIDSGAIVRPNFDTMVENVLRKKGLIL